MPENIEYIHWEDVFRNDYLPIYDYFMRLRNSNDVPVDYLIECYLGLFECAYIVLRHYLANKGLFYTPKEKVIRVAYRVYLIDNGRLWLDIMNIVEDIENPEKRVKLLQYFADDYIKIYKDLREKLSKELINDK